MARHDSLSRNPEPDRHVSVVDAKDPEPDHAAIYGRMKARMLGMFGQSPWIQDVIHSAFETFLNKAHTYRGEGSLGAFADAIALNAARDAMRRQRRSSLLLSVFTERPTWPPLTPTPEAETADRDRIRRLQSILESMSPKYRLPYLLHNVENMPISDIARVEGVSEDAIRKRLTRARTEIHRRARKDPVLAEWLEAEE